MIDDRKPRERQEPKFAMPGQGAGGKADKGPAPVEEARGEARAKPARRPAAAPDATTGESSGQPQPRVAPDAMPEGPPEAAQQARQEVLQEVAPEVESAAAEAGGSEARIAALEAENAELRDQLLRALADVENTRRRLQRELEEKLKYAPASLAKDLLGVADNLGRALAAVPAEARQQEVVQSLVTGVEMTEKALMDAFAKHGIERIDPLGQKLDPHRHEAMMELEDPTKPSGTVAQVFESGYEMKGRLLRPARVAVAKGGPAAGGPAEPGSTVDTKA